MSEIKATQPLAQPHAPRPASLSTELALKLVQPLQGLLAIGESSVAEVVEVRQAAQDFQIALRLTLDNGRQATLNATSPAPVSLGSAYTVTALAQNRLLASLQPALQQPLESLDSERVPPGTRLQAKVVASQADIQGATKTFKIVVDLLDTPLAGRRLIMESSRPLPVGSLLTAQVRDNLALTFVPLGDQQDRLELSHQLNTQFARQASLLPLFDALQTTDDLPPASRQAADRLLALLPDMQQLTDARVLAKTLQESGLFFETKLLAGQTENTQDDLKAGLLRLIAQLPPNLPGSSPQAFAQISSGMAQALPALARQMLGALGASSRQQALDFPLPNRLLPGLGDNRDLESLLKLASAAISRLQTHQLASLAQTQTTPEGLTQTTWQLEIPMRNGNDIVPLQAWIQREEESAPASQQERNKNESRILWKIELAFDVSPLGLLQVQAQLLDGTLSSQLWAEQPHTAQLVSSELDNLRQRLLQAGLNVGELSCRQGIPTQTPRTTLEQRFVDETA
ncbi:flagellar hook-length control protein FliK [Azomonas macrocytogenes]|nr:flagellar hook-length control protein FliK [Azomonas macrocytogenes]